MVWFGSVVLPKKTLLAKNQVKPASQSVSQQPWLLCLGSGSGSGSCDIDAADSYSVAAGREHTQDGTDNLVRLSCPSIYLLQSLGAAAFFFPSFALALAFTFAFTFTFT